MPVIDKPEGRGPLFTGRAQIFIGGPLVHQLREWKKRKKATSAEKDES